MWSIDITSLYIMYLEKITYTIGWIFFSQWEQEYGLYNWHQHNKLKFKLVHIHVYTIKGSVLNEKDCIQLLQIQCILKYMYHVLTMLEL